MIRTFNRPEIAEALARFLSFKGKISLQAEEQIVPVVNIGDIANSPYLRYGVPVAESDTIAAAGAGELGFVAIRPGATVCLAVRQIVVPATANFMSLSVRVCTLAQLAAAGSVEGPKVLDLSAEEIGATRSSVLNTGSDAAFIGNGMFGITVPANGATVVYEFPEPGLILYGNNPNGRGALVVQENAANRDLHLGFVAREWPLPG